MKMEVGGRNKTCRYMGKSYGNCCRHTLVEAAKWDFEARGKCWVLRSIQGWALRSILSSSAFKGFGVYKLYGGIHPDNVVSLIIYLLYFLLVDNVSLIYLI